MYNGLHAYAHIMCVEIFSQTFSFQFKCIMGVAHVRFVC